MAEHGLETRLAAHLPRYLGRLLEEMEPADLVCRPIWKEGAVLFADISGFTPLSEALGRHGKAGTEALTDIINGYLTSLIEVLERWGGDVVKFGGDAVTVLFEVRDGESQASALLRACAAALAAFETLGAERLAETPWETFPLRLKIGIGGGRLLAGVIGEASDRMEHVLAGSALDAMAEAEHHAKPGQAVLHLGAPGLAQAGLFFEPLEEGFALLKGAADLPAAPPTRSSPSPLAARVRPFLLPAVHGQIEAGTEALLSEHRQVSTVFVSFAGLEYSQAKSLGLLHEYFQKVAGLLKGFGGSFNRMDMGDKGSKLLCFFGAPESAGNNEERAVAFALGLRELEPALTWVGRQRIGITAGTAFCGVVGSPGRMEYTVMGDTVNASARLMGASQGGILVSEEVRGACRHQYRWGPYRSVAVKGKAQPLRVSTPLHPLRRKRQRPASAVVSLVGREAELADLRKALAKVARIGNPALLAVEGDAGLGKTALLTNFLAECASKGSRTAFGACPAVNPRPYEPWVEVFNSLLSEAGQGDLAAAWAAVLPGQGVFIPLGLQFLGVKAEVSQAVLSLSPSERREKTLDLLAKTLTAFAESRPLVGALDDFHQADEASRELLSEMVSRSRGAILFLTAVRPGGSLPPKTRSIALSPLAAEGIRDLAQRSLGTERVPDGLLECLRERSGGNPLFLLELLQAFREKGLLKAERDGRVRWDASASDLPGSVEELLLSRLDLLPLKTRNLLKVVSCLGMSFELGLAQAVFLPRLSPEEVEEHLRALVPLGMSSGEGPHAGRWSFPHASLRDAAYGSVLLANRRSIHLLAGEFLEGRPESETEPHLPAYHFGEAGAWGRAAFHGLKAARAFVERYAFKEALKQYGQVEAWAESVGQAIPPGDTLSLAECAIQAGEHERALEAIARVQVAEEAAEDQRLAAEELLLRILDAKGEYLESVKQAEKLASEAGEGAYRALAVDAMRFGISGLFRLGRLREAEGLLERAKGLAKEGGLGAHEAPLAILEGGILMQRGKFEESVAAYGRALGQAEIMGSYPVSMRARLGMANAFREMGKVEESIAHAEKAFETAKLIGSRENVLGAATALATAQNWSGKQEEAKRVLEEAGSGLDPAKMPYAACAYWNQLGVTHYYLGAYKRALFCYRKCRGIARKIGSGQWAAAGTYNIADALKTIGQSESAYREYKKALAGFRRIEDTPYFVQASKDVLSLLEGREDEKAAFLKKTSKILVEWGKAELIEKILSRG